MTVPLVGLTRVVVTALAATGLTLAAGAVPTLDLSHSDRVADTAVAEPGRAPATLCVGPDLGGLKGAPDVPQDVTILALASPATDRPDATDPTAQTVTLTAGEVTAEGTGRVAAQVTAPVPATIRSSAGAGPVALQAFRADTPDLRGLAVAPCPAPTADVWLVGGGGAPGRQERLVLANPGANEVVADVTVHGSSGPVASDTGRSIVVPGAGRASILLDAIAPGESAPAVHVTVSGGTVVALLSDTWLDGSVPAGLDATVAGAEPGTTLVLPILDLTQAGMLRIVVPGDVQAVVEADLLSTTGSAPLPGGAVHRIPAGTTLDLPLGDIPAGSYAIRILADVPVLAAGLSTARAEAAPGDFAWTPAASPLRTLAGTPLPPADLADGRQLALVAPRDTMVTVTTRSGTSQESSQVAVPAGRLTTIDLPAADGLWVDPADPDAGVHGAILLTSGTGPERLLAVLPLREVVTAATPVAAHPGP